MPQHPDKRRFKPSRVKTIRVGWVLSLSAGGRPARIFRGTARVAGRNVRYRISAAQKKLLDEVLDRYHGAWERLAKK